MEAAGVKRGGKRGQSDSEKGRERERPKPDQEYTSSNRWSPQRSLFWAHVTCHSRIILQKEILQKAISFIVPKT